MTPIIRFYRDQDGQPRVASTPEFFSLGGFLESDMQDVATVEEMLVKAQRVKTEDEVSGNAYVAIMTPDQVVLESQFDEDELSCRISMDVLKKLLTEWLEFLANDSLISLVPQVDFRQE